MDKLSFTPIKNKKTYLQIVDKILTMVYEGELEYGDKLFSEPELIKMLNVSRPTLREALRVLEFLGIVSIGTRSGITINNPQDNINYLPLIYAMLFEKPTNTDLFELRRAIQVEAAGLAALRHTEEDRKILRDIVLKTEANMKSDHTFFSQLDYDFHLAVVNASKNVLSVKLMQTLGELMRRQLLDIIEELKIENRSRTLKYHTAICNAIISKDETKSRRIMEEHLSVTYKDIKKKEIIKFTLE